MVSGTRFLAKGARHLVQVAPAFVIRARAGSQVR